jgi:hypothetical protein
MIEAGFVDYKIEKLVLSENIPEEYQERLKAAYEYKPVVTFNARKPN